MKRKWLGPWNGGKSIGESKEQSTNGCQVFRRPQAEKQKNQRAEEKGEKVTDGGPEQQAIERTMTKRQCNRFGKKKNWGIERVNKPWSRRREAWKREGLRSTQLQEVKRKKQNIGGELYRKKGKGELTESNARVQMGGPGLKRRLEGKKISLTQKNAKTRGGGGKKMARQVA